MRTAAILAMLAPWWIMPPTAPHTEPVMQSPAPSCASCDVYNKAAKTADDIQRLTSDIEAHIRRQP